LRPFPSWHGNPEDTVEGRAGRALGDQLRSLDKKRLRKRIGRLSSSQMRDVDEAIRITLALHSTD
jgi:mRNA-degrading endonuclease toxin of MazEF toxin-antitoxin module